MVPWKVPIGTGLALCIAALVSLPGPAARADDLRMEQLAPANKALAQRMLASVARWDRKYRDRAMALNGGPPATDGPPVFPGAARCYELAEGLFEQFNDAYLEIVARRANQSYTKEDEARRDDMRKRWLTDQLFADPFSSKVVPFEVWSLSDMPPVIRF